MLTSTVCRAILVLHALFALAMGGASTHLVLVTVGLQRADRVFASKVRLTRIYSQVTGWLFAGTLLIGAVVYPTYRYFVRGLFLDRYAPWASNLFDFKENIAAGALPFAVALIWLGRRFDGTDAEVRMTVAACAFVVFSVVAFDIVSGLIIVAVRSV
jgi:hypothetical protein